MYDFHTQTRKIRAYNALGKVGGTVQERATGPRPCPGLAKLGGFRRSGQRHQPTPLPPVTDVTPHNKKTLTSCSMHQFKIGITERPDLRWPMYKNSKDDIKWTTMFILYAAPTSKSAMCSSDSTALQA